MGKANGSRECAPDGVPTILAHRRHPEVLAALGGEPRRMGHKRLRPSFETPRKRAAPQDDGGARAAIRLVGTAQERLCPPYDAVIFSSESPPWETA
jgi:hypothetical protein